MPVVDDQEQPLADPIRDALRAEIAQTVLDADLVDDEVLALADSLLRWGHLTKPQLVRAADAMRGTVNLASNGAAQFNGQFEIATAATASQESSSVSDFTGMSRRPSARMMKGRIGGWSRRRVLQL